MLAVMSDNLQIYDHGFEPKSEHCACMVDILAWCGRLEEVVEYINTKMHFARDVA